MAWKHVRSIPVFVVLTCAVCSLDAAEAPPLRIATFQVDATPPLGSPLCGGSVDPAREIVDPLSARGIVLLTAGRPVVLCAVDWVGIGNGGHDAWREALAEAAGTSVDCVSVHTLHQHDAPACDFSTEELLAEHGLSGEMFDVKFSRGVIARAAAAVAEAVQSPQPVTHLGTGAAPVEQVASNRRLLADNGKVHTVRFSSSRIPEAISAAEGVVDQQVKLISLWNEDQPLVAITHYATHPQSYYGQGGVSADFVGMARELRERALPNVVHIHFDGAGGNVAAGKYNNGAPEVRPVLAQRLAAGMQAAWDQTERIPLEAADVHWDFQPVSLPARDFIVDTNWKTLLANEKSPKRERMRAARNLAFLQRANGGKQIHINCLTLGPARVLYMPGELFIEYQLAAQALRPDLFVAMAAYGDYGPGYIGTQVAYPQGGYETSRVSRTAPEVEAVLIDAMQKLMAE